MKVKVLFLTIALISAWDDHSNDDCHDNEARLTQGDEWMDIGKQRGKA